MTENYEVTVMFTDATTAVVDGRLATKVGSLTQWVAYIRAGYTVNSRVRPFNGRGPTYTLSQIAPELGPYVMKVSAEVRDHNLSDEDLADFVNLHAEYFSGYASADEV